MGNIIDCRTGNFGFNVHIVCTVYSCCKFSLFCTVYIYIIIFRYSTVQYVANVLIIFSFFLRLLRLLVLTCPAAVCQLFSPLTVLGDSGTVPAGYRLQSYRSFSQISKNQHKAVNSVKSALSLGKQKINLDQFIKTRGSIKVCINY